MKTEGEIRDLVKSHSALIKLIREYAETRSTCEVPFSTSYSDWWDISRETTLVAVHFGRDDTITVCVPYNTDAEVEFPMSELWNPNWDAHREETARKKASEKAAHEAFLLSEVKRKEERELAEYHRLHEKYGKQTSTVEENN